MRWIRKTWVLLATCISLYFLVVHTGPDRFEFSLVILLGFIVVFGTAFFDRMFYDPSSIFIAKPWRMMQPSAGDTFRLVFLVSILVSLLMVFVIGFRGHGFAAFRDRGATFGALFVEVARRQHKQHAVTRT